MRSAQQTDRTLDALMESSDRLFARIREIETSDNIGVRYVQTQNGTLARLKEEYRAQCDQIRELK